MMQWHCVSARVDSLLRCRAGTGAKATRDLSEAFFYHTRSTGHGVSGILGLTETGNMNEVVMP